MAKTQNQNALELLKALAAQLGMSLAPITPTEPAPAVRRRTTRTYKSAVASGNAVTAMAQATPTPTAPTMPAKAAKLYGKAPVANGAHGMPDAVGTHQARLAALEKAIPGITREAYVFSIGKNAAGKLEKTLSRCVNNPFTYIELPGGKNQTVGSMDADAVRAAIKLCGYGFTKQHDRQGNSCAFWATDCHGNPVNRRYGAHKQNVAANLVNEDD